MSGFSIDDYYNYASGASRFRAMYINIANYRLYFSFGHLVAFEWGGTQYISTENFGKRTENHKTWIKNNHYGYSYNSLDDIEQGELEGMVSAQVLGVPYRCNFDFYSYAYNANNSKYKAMCAVLGDFKLYYSYNTLIGFETPKAQYITEKHFSHTTQGHKYSARNWKKTPMRVQDSVLELIVLTNLLKLPFEEAKDVAGVHCERIHFS